MINQYFQSQAGIASEQQLVDDLTVELIQQSGHDFQFIPRELNQTTDDQILHESPLSTFTTYFTIEGLVENYDGFGDQQDIMAQFGMLQIQELTITFSRSRFLEVTGMEHGPIEGSLIYYSPTDSLFEVTTVDDEPDFITLGAQTKYKVRAKLFQYSHETIQTGIPEVDDISTLDFGYANNELIEDAADEVTTFDPDNPLGGW
jgi:hypothetical protein